MAIQSLPIKSNTVITGNGANSRLNITASTVVKAVAGRIAKVTVVTAGTGEGTINDAATVGAAAVANQVFEVPTTVGTYSVDFPVSNGIVVVPGPGQVLAVSYS